MPQHLASRSTAYPHIYVIEIMPVFGAFCAEKYSERLPSQDKSWQVFWYPFKFEPSPLLQLQIRRRQ